ncbi:MAG TPA: hypothetical protein VMN60_05360 [Longimicrobiales bacterium]|nr:hypothetical protein [Longimicrobiales bacterium]
MIVRDARAEFFRLAGLPGDGGYSAQSIHFRIGFFSFALPNSAARKKAVRLHDLHHLATGYDTSWTGEAEMAAWELASGCASYRAAWLLNLLAFPLGLMIAPVRTWRAFRRGRASANLYASPWDERWLDASLGQLRARLIPDRDTRTAHVSDMLLFLLYAMPGLFGMVVLILGLAALR